MRLQLRLLKPLQLKLLQLLKKRKKPNQLSTTLKSTPRSTKRLLLTLLPSNLAQA